MPDPWFAPIPPKVGVVELPIATTQAALVATSPDASDAQIEVRPTLIPLESPFIDGHRYRLAQATELRTRLDLYVEDEGGPWLRKHGVLIAAAGGRGIKS